MSNHSESIIEIACIGDSLTAGKDGYPSHLQKLLGSTFKVKNYGAGGCTMLKKGDMPYWTDGLLLKVLKTAPNIVTVMLGTNDTKPHNWIYKNELKTDYIEMISALKKLSSKPKLFIVLPVPVFKTNYGIANERLFEVHSTIREIAEEEGLQIIDTYTPLLRAGEYFSDGVHPDKIASEIIATVFYQTLKNSNTTLR